MLRPLSRPALRLRNAGPVLQSPLPSPPRGGRAIEEGKLRELLESLQRGALSVEEAVARLRRLPHEDLGFADLDHHRALRKGFPEVILGQGKTREQVAAIAERLAAGADRLLITRVDARCYRAVRERLPDAVYHPAAR